MIKKIIIACIVFQSVVILSLPVLPLAQADESKEGVVLTDDRGKIIYCQNNKERFIPASIIKLLTSLAAIHYLGENFQFPTNYFLDKSSKNLYIKGFGDPLLISEVVYQLCQDILQKTKAKQINHIILDQTYFHDKIQIPGKGYSLNPYDAPVGALCANFNTIMFKWSTQKNQFVSAEPQTPLLRFFYNDIVKTNLKTGRIILSQDQSRLYPGLLIKYFLERYNTQISGDVLYDKLEIKTNEGQVFLSPFKMKTVIQKLLKYSNNFIANQLLLTLGAYRYGAPATLQKGVMAVKEYSKQQLEFNELTYFEGSGLSRSNLISPNQMIDILLNFMPFFSLLNNQENDFFKTGTLDGVRTRAGYFLGSDDRLYPYVIMVNKKNKGYSTIHKKLKKLVLKMNQKAESIE